MGNFSTCQALVADSNSSSSLILALFSARRPASPVRHDVSVVRREPVRHGVAAHRRHHQLRRTTPLGTSPRHLRDQESCPWTQFRNSCGSTERVRSSDGTEVVSGNSYFLVFCHLFTVHFLLQHLPLLVAKTISSFFKRSFSCLDSQQS